MNDVQRSARLELVRTGLEVNTDFLVVYCVLYTRPLNGNAKRITKVSKNINKTSTDICTSLITTNIRLTIHSTGTREATLNLEPRL